MDRANLLARALREPDLDRACELIQDALDITDGGVAGLVFSALPEDGDGSWPTLSVEARGRYLSEWLHAEIVHAL
jgi:hypothetical protein